MRIRKRSFYYSEKQMPDIVLSDGRISPLTYALDEVFYKSSIKDLRKYYFSNSRDVTHWLLLSDYYFEDEAPNKVITFSVMPYFMDVRDLQSQIHQLAPKDIKHTRNVNEEFIKLLKTIPMANFSFLFAQSKYWIWDSKDEMKSWLLREVDIIKLYIDYWMQTNPRNAKRLHQLSKSIRCLEKLIQEEKKLRLIAPLYFVSLLGGYIGSILYREAGLSTLAWLSDRDSTNEICFNVVRELFQITLINIIKANIQFVFTSANSHSDEWYKELIRIPDYLTGTIAKFDFAQNQITKDKFGKILHLHFRRNFENTFLFRFITDSDRIRVQRMAIL